MVITSKKRAEMERRRQQVAANLLAGLGYRDIAAALGVSLGTVAGDARFLLNRWRGEQVSATEDLFLLEQRRLDRALNAIWNNVLAGKLAAVNQFRKLSESRRRLLGLDAPTRREITGRNGGPLKIDSDTMAVAARELEAWRVEMRERIQQIAPPTE